MLYCLRLKRQPAPQDIDGPFCFELSGTSKRLGLLDRTGELAHPICTFHADWPDKASVKQEFKSLSPAGTGALADAVNKLKAAGVMPKAGVTAPAAAPSKHINIGIFQ